MIQIAVLRDQLSLDRRSLTEIATALSVAAMLGATLYNLGFFAPVEWSLISVLTVQDLLIGASIALLPMSVGAWLALLIARFIANAPQLNGLVQSVSQELGLSVPPTVDQLIAQKMIELDLPFKG